MALKTFGTIETIDTICVIIWKPVDRPDHV